MLASENGHTDTVQILLSAGANPNITNGDVRTINRVTFEKIKRGFSIHTN